MKKGIIIYNEDKPLATGLYHEYKEFLEKYDIQILGREDIEKGDFVVVIGGDGTLLRASKIIAKKDNIDVFAVNAGSLGFLTEIKKEEFKSTFIKYLNGKYQIEERFLLEVIYKNKKYYILNEVVVTKKTPLSQLIDLQLEIKNHTLFSTRGDGIIISTPTGSTAYSLSAGGPIVTPHLDVVLITPLAPHNLSSRPIIISNRDNISLCLQSKEEGYIILDGDIELTLSHNEKLELHSCDKKIKLILPQNRSYYDVLHEKLRWNQ